MAKKKKEEVIVIQKTELMPTTIGVLNEKENSPIFAFVWIIVFVVGIIVLPYVASIINGEDVPIFSNHKKEEVKKENPDTPTNEIQYYDINETTSFLVEGFQFSKFSFQEGNVSFRVVNISGDEKLFFNQNYYVELYNNDSTLLERFKLENKEIKNFNDYEFSSTKIADASKIAVVLKEEKDYPPVSLNRDTNNNYLLECRRDDIVLTYKFSEVEKEYTLNEIDEKRSISSSHENYESLLTEYTTKVNSYESVSGVEASLMPTSTGFHYVLSLNLKKISTSNKNRYFNQSIYYKKDTLAKVIAFELETEGYTCN